MSQVLGKPQPEDEDDDEEEDELVGLADYGDGPDSSDADPDSGAEEGESRKRPFIFPRSVKCCWCTAHKCRSPDLWNTSRACGVPRGWWYLFREGQSPIFFLDFSDPFSTEVKPRILLMGLRRSGKSSIQKVVFHKMSPNETLFLESTNKICREDVSNSSFVNFQIWDFPGQIDFFDPTFDYEMIFRGTGALIFVIDSQDDYMEALARLHLTVTRAYKVNTDINFEVFIHKVDGLSDDHKIETQRDIHQRANDDLADAGLEKIHLSFYLTSIYDHSIFEAFSKVVQKLIPQLPTLENLLNIFISNSGIEKAFLFDVVSKIYIATDSTPVDMQTYELCCDMIDVVIDISCIYGLKEDGAGTPYDKESTAIIKLNNTTVLYLKEVTKFLALVCFVREESFERKGLIDYNFHCFRKAIHEVFEVRMKVVKSRKAQNRLQKKKGATPNGTPRVLL
uniref:Ras-related GTP-binding protein n=1 Tax=Loxodonta africana TaxID=9785 RepID=G3ULQ0_LOXAF